NKIINNLLIKFIYMSNGHSDLDKYFPAGSAELNSVRQREENLIQSGTFTDTTPLVTKREFNTAITKMEKDANRKFLYGIAIGIIGILVTIITAILLC
ncbi:MAG TPA: hypothetical protein VN377_03925, partial [Candidatus Thermoplasmatota archaeon]|nr:hypothetical protein [Candidatus Thermoplasmatota archaeon]